MAWNNRPSRKLFRQFSPEGTEDLEEWKARFINTRDPTEYAGAIELVGSWKEWLYFKRTWPMFTREILPEWMAEMEVLIRSEALQTMIQDARSKSRSATSSARWVAEGGYKPKKEGGPTKSEKAREEMIRSAVVTENEDDISRVMSVFNKETVN